MVVDEIKKFAGENLIRINNCVKKFDTFDKSKAESTEFEYLRQRFDKMADIEHINHVKDVLLPKLEKVLNSQEILLESSCETQECVRKLDASISIKANKFDLNVLSE